MRTASGLVRLAAAALATACAANPRPSSEPEPVAVDTGAPQPPRRPPRDAAPETAPDAATPTGTPGEACGVPDACVHPGPRDPASWPFSACSPWNRPIGTGAQYAAIAPDAPWRRFGWMSHKDSHPIYIEGTPPAHMGVIRAPNDGEGRKAAWSMLLPDAIQPATGSDDLHLHVVDIARRHVIETLGARLEGPDVVASAAIRNDLHGTGIATSPTVRCTWHGTRAYGGSAIGGLVRKGELTDGIRHALALQIPQQAMNKNSPNGFSWVWPAGCADRDKTLYGTEGNVFMGTLLAIPPSADLTKIKNPMAANLARAFRDYGGYVVDRGANSTATFGSGVGIYVEPNEAPEAREITYDDLKPVISLLQVVTNNAPETPGGGGRPLTCFAPAL